MTDRERELLEALTEIRDAHLPDQPASVDVPEYDWAVRHIRTLRTIAQTAVAKAEGR